MRTIEALACLQFAASIATAKAIRPRGVGPEFAKFYTDESTFTCLSSPDIQLSRTRVNDDYCDCPDGSDEPGTSACAHLSPLSPPSPATGKLPGALINASLGLPGFYCKNKGHVPAYIPFTSVNDGYCDYDVCCDGSEEWSGLVKCEDRCKEIGKEFRKIDEARQASLTKAAAKRKELVADAARLRKQVEDRLQSLGTEIQGSEKKVQQLEAEFVEIEKKEKGKIVKSGESTVGKMNVLIEMSQNRIDELRQSLIRVRRERDEKKEKLTELETMLAKFKEEYNPNFNDEGVKRAVRAWEDYVAKHDDSETYDDSEAFNQDLDTFVLGDAENGLDWAQFIADDENDTDVLYAFENYLPPSVRTWLDQKLRDLRVTLIDAGILAASSASSGESKVLTDARNRLSAAKKELEDSQKSLTEHKENLEKNWGPDDVFRALEDTCIEVESGEYTYETCFLRSTTQKPKKGGGNVNMGKFERFDVVEVDDQLPADGKGLGSGSRIALRYENGQHCWNGPSRSTLVVLGCAEEGAIWKVIEEEKCVYRMEVGTPAVCEAGGAAKKVDGGDGAKKRDEL